MADMGSTIILLHLNKTTHEDLTVIFGLIFLLLIHVRDIFSNIRCRLGSSLLCFGLRERPGCRPYKFSDYCNFYYIFQQNIHKIVKTKTIITDQIHKLLKNKC